MKTLLFSILLFARPLVAQDYALFDDYIDQWHLAAAKADYTLYFELMDEAFVFLGTDPTERWTKAEFSDYCRPYFNKGKAWDFKPMERHWEGDPESGIIWFDEILDTHMNTCRGSGIMKLVDGEWKLVYYNLTVLIENEKMEDFRALRAKEN